MVSKAFDCVVFYKSRMLHGRMSSHATMFLQNLTNPMSRFSLNEPGIALAFSSVQTQMSIRGDHTLVSDPEYMASTLMFTSRYPCRARPAIASRERRRSTSTSSLGTPRVAVRLDTAERVGRPVPARPLNHVLPSYHSVSFLFKNFAFRVSESVYKHVGLSHPASCRLL